MGPLLRIRIKFAARAYARYLSRALRQGWGRSEHYTPGQIAVSVKRLKLDANLIALGYAAFLTEDQFDALALEMPLSLPYKYARNLVRRHLLSGHGGQWEPMEQINPFIWDGNSGSGGEGRDGDGGH